MQLFMIGRYAVELELVLLCLHATRLTGIEGSEAVIRYGKVGVISTSMLISSDSDRTDLRLSSPSLVISFGSQ